MEVHLHFTAAHMEVLTGISWIKSIDLRDGTVELYQWDTVPFCHKYEGVYNVEVIT